MLAHEDELQEHLTSLRRAFAVCAEWLLSFPIGDFAVQTNEIEILAQNGKLIVSCPTPRGWQRWIIKNLEQTGGKIILAVVPKLIGSGINKLEFTPRIASENLREDVKIARLLKAREMAETARKTFSQSAIIERVSLSQSNQRGKVGTVARVLLTLPNKKSVAVCGSIIEKTVLENLLANAVLWFAKLQERRRINELWLIVEPQNANDLQKIIALLRGGWRDAIKIYQRENNSDAASDNLDEQILRAVPTLNLTDLWREKPKQPTRPKNVEMSETARRFLEIAPDAIDLARSRYGETLRFHGMPFLRVKTIFGVEQIWFGTDAKHRKELSAETLPEFEDLFKNLRQHRTADALDKRNALYKAASEAWLESILRRDVRKLDPNLILAPLFAQFRLSNKIGALDLLALRTDGRLVVIELKTAPDREHVFQAVNYWRQIEAQRRAGNLDKIKLFSDLRIADAPPLVYTVAPLMSFHRDFEFLTRTITQEIEIWRFDLNEDWRGGIRVARRSDFKS